MQKKVLFQISLAFVHTINWQQIRDGGYWAAEPAETPGKYEYDWNYLTYTFAKSKFPVTEKLANGALVTPIPTLPQVMAWRWPGDVFKSNKQIDLYHHLSICVASRNKLIVYVAGFL